MHEIIINYKNIPTEKIYLTERQFKKFNRCILNYIKSDMKNRTNLLYIQEVRDSITEIKISDEHYKQINKIVELIKQEIDECHTKE